MPKLQTVDAAFYFLPQSKFLLQKFTGYANINTHKGVKVPVLGDVAAGIPTTKAGRKHKAQRLLWNALIGKPKRKK